MSDRWGVSRSDRSQSWRRRGTCSTTRRTRSTRPPPCSPPPPTPTASGLPPRGHTASRSASRSPPRRAQRARSPPRTAAARACDMCSWRPSSCSRPPPANARSPTSTAPSSSSPASTPPAPSRPAPPPSRPPPRRASAGVSPATGAAPSACASRWAEPPGSAASACGATWAYATAVSERCVLSCSGPQLTLCAADQTPQSRTPPGRPHLCPRPGGAHRPAGRDAAEKSGRGSRPGRLYDPWRRPSHRQRVVDRCRAGRKRALGYEYSSSCTLVFFIFPTPSN